MTKLAKITNECIRLLASEWHMLMFMALMF